MTQQTEVKSELFKVVKAENQGSSEPAVVETQGSSEGQESKTQGSLVEQFNRISKQEKYIASERKKIEEAKIELETAKADAAAYRALKGKEPFEILESLGISYEQLLEADKKRRNPVDPMVQKALDEVNNLKMQLTSKEKEAEQERISKAEIQLKADIDEEIKTGEFDLIDKLDAKDAVREYMEEMFATTGEIPSIKEACEAITEHLAVKYEAVRESKWLKPKEVPKSEPEVLSVAKSQTISNKMTQASTTSDKPVTESDRIKEALRILTLGVK